MRYDIVLLQTYLVINLELALYSPNRMHMEFGGDPTHVYA